ATYLARALEIDAHPDANTDDTIEFVDGRVLDRHSEPLRVRGRVAGRVWCYRDVTTARRTETELRNARDAAEAGNRAKSEFLANMSHEIRTPMNGIVGMVELLFAASPTPEQREYLNIARSSAESLLTIINDILDFSKIEAGRLDLEEIEFSVRDLLDSVVKGFGVTAAPKGVELACAVARSLPDTVYGDPTRLRQVLDNLIGNALKFTDNGEVIVRAELMAAERGSALVRFSVSDTGIGIDPEKQDEIFEAFSQADASTTRKYGGTGLGLTISSRLVAMMGGKLQLDSEPQRGSRFHFMLPLRCAGAAREDGP